jgi:hypothetical protein
MPAKHQPDKSYLRHVNTKRVHLFTIIQVLSTAGLYCIKYVESVAITFPILVKKNFFQIFWNIITCFFFLKFKVLATCGIRKLLDYIFTQRELFWLDDILPGSKLNDKENKNKNDAHLNDKVDSSEDNFFKNNAKNFSRKSSVSITFFSSYFSF